METASAEGRGRSWRVSAGLCLLQMSFLRPPLDVLLVLYECGQGGGWLLIRHLSPVHDLLGLPLPAQ